MVEFSSRSLQFTRRIRHMGRLAQITNVFAKHGLWSFAERLGIDKWLTPEQAKAAAAMSRGEGDPGTFDFDDVKGLPARLRRSFEELGPAFVKLGQVLAVREDLLPKAYIEELGKLHSQVAALPFATIRQVIVQELGEEKLAGFAEIIDKPLAAGSIAQVHEARLQTGQRVVIKVQRPGIDQQIKIDLSLIAELAGLVERYIPETRPSRPTAVIREFSRAMLGELDFIREGGNITKIARNFAGFSHVVIPEVFWRYSTSRVITMTLLDGIPAWDRQRMIDAGLNPSLLVERGLHMFLKMVFVDGLYHGDLHPGNLLALPDSQVGVLDFGVAVHLGRSTRENLAGLLIALVEEDFSRAVLHYMELAEPSMEFDAEAFEHEVGNAVAPFIGLSLQELRSGKLFWDLATVAARYGAPMPQELMVFVKTLASFEGIGTHLDPGFDVLVAAEKFTAEIAAEIYSPENLKRQGLTIARDLGQLARHAPFQVRRLLKAALEGQLNLNITSHDVERLAVSFDRSSSRLAVSIIIAALIIGSSILAFAQRGQDLATIPLFGLIGFALAGVLGLYVIWSVMRRP